MHTPGPRFCVLPRVLLNMLDICVLLYVLIVVCAAPYAQYLCAALCANCWMLLLDMLNICMLLCVLIVVCVARCTYSIFMCCFMCLLLYVPLDMLDIFSVALFQCATSLAYAPTIYVALELGTIGHSDAA